MSTRSQLTKDLNGECIFFSRENKVLCLQFRSFKGECQNIDDKLFCNTSVYIFLTVKS